MIEIITGNLLDAKEKYICHQCNCVSHMAAGVAKAIFDEFTYSDIYSQRISYGVPGTIIVKGNGKNERFVVNMLSQYYPGGPRPINAGNIEDDERTRQKLFNKCLMALAKITDLESIAFPHRIGCGLAGGDWNWYKGTLDNFANYVYKMQNAKVVIYQREEDK